MGSPAGSHAPSFLTVDSDGNTLAGQPLLKGDWPDSDESSLSDDLPVEAGGLTHSRQGATFKVPAAERRSKLGPGRRDDRAATDPAGPRRESSPPATSGRATTSIAAGLVRKRASALLGEPTAQEQLGAE